MLTVALVAALSGASVWQLRQAIEVEQTIRLRAQMDQILRGAAELGGFLAKERFDRQRESIGQGVFLYHFVIDDYGNFHDKSQNSNRLLRQHIDNQSATFFIRIYDLNSCLNVRNLSSPELKDGYARLENINGLLSVKESLNIVASSALDLMLKTRRHKSNRAADYVSSLIESRNGGGNSLFVYHTEDFVFSKFGLHEGGREVKKFDLCFDKIYSKINVNNASIDLVRAIGGGALASIIASKREHNEYVDQIELDQMLVSEGLEGVRNEFVTYSSFYRVEVTLHQGMTQIQQQYLYRFQ